MLLLVRIDYQMRLILLGFNESLSKCIWLLVLKLKGFLNFRIMLSNFFLLISRLQLEKCYEFIFLN